MYAEIARAPRRARPRRAHRRALPAAPRSGDERRPRCTDEELRDQLVTLLLAGHETTATALAWALLRARPRPRASAPRPRDGRRDGDDDYLEAVLKESMRLHPVIPMVVRT